MKNNKETLTPERVKKLTDSYFEFCRGEAVSCDGKPQFDKNGQEIRRGVRPPTLSGLALYLGFSSKEEMLSFEGGEGAKRELARARLRIEQYAEERLFDREGLKGAEFSLKTNFGWQDSGALSNGEGGKIIIPDAEEGQDE